MLVFFPRPTDALIISADLARLGLGNVYLTGLRGRGSSCGLLIHAAENTATIIVGIPAGSVMFGCTGRAAHIRRI